MDKLPKILCLRCPDPLVDCEGRNDLAKCEAEDELSNLWRGFSNDPDCSPSILLSDQATCENLLKIMRANDKATVKGARSRKEPVIGQLDEVERERQKEMFGGQAVKKQHLEYAFQCLYFLVPAQASAISVMPTLTSAAASKGDKPTIASTSVESTASLPSTEVISAEMLASEINKIQLAEKASSPADTPARDTSKTQLAKKDSSSTAAPPSAKISTTVPTAATQSRTAFPDSRPTLDQPKAVAITSTNVSKQAAAKHDPRDDFVKDTDVIGLDKKKQYAMRKSFVKDKPEFEVYTNHFKIDLDDNVTLYEHTVSSGSLEWQNATKNKRKVLMRSLIDNCDPLFNNFDTIATDYHSKIISAKQLFAAPQDVAVTSFRAGTDTQTTINITVRPSQSFPMKKLQQYVSGEHINYEETGAAEAMNIVIAKVISDGSPDTFQAGNNKFFYRPGWTELAKKGSPSADGLIAVRGYSCSVRPSMGTATLNINTLTSAFYRAQTVHDYSGTVKNLSGKAVEKELSKISNHLAGLCVYVDFERGEAYPDSPDIDSHRRRTKTIAEIKSLASTPSFFKNGAMTDIATHIKDMYLALNMSGNQFAVNIGGRKQNQQYYMSKHLKVLGDQIFRRTLPPALVDGMINAARRTPDENRNAILGEGIVSLGLHANSSPIFRKLGIKISPNMMSVPARLALAPRIQYKNQTIGVRNASWKLASGQKFVKTNNKFHSESENPMVGFICVDSVNAENRKKYIDDFLALHHQYGLQKLKLSTPKNRYYISSGEARANWSVTSLQTAINGMIRDEKKGKVSLVILMLPSKNQDNLERYAHFKIACDQMLGIKSAVLCEETMAHTKMAGYMGNVAMKLNMRLGNSNHHLQKASLHIVSEGDCIIIGADVTHPSGGGNRFAPSIAALVGSVDNNYAHYPGSMRLQPRRQEQIQDLKAMAKECFTRWSKKNGDRMPSRILFYRDGVGESYYDAVQKQEVTQIQAAWLDMANQVRDPPKVKEPSITAVIVAKRHNTRFYPKNGVNSLKGNCMSGTVVDSGVTSPYFFDFFLQSHNPLQGTAKPAHYFVLENGMDFTEQQLQELTYNLCFHYGRSTTAVSYVPPAYYADRLCERGRHYLRAFFSDSEDLKDLDDDTVKQKYEQAFYRQGTVGQPGNPWHSNLDDTMFWM